MTTVKVPLMPKGVEHYSSLSVLPGGSSESTFYAERR